MSQKERINFNAPPTLVEIADLVAELRGVSRTALLTEALEARVNQVLTDEAFRSELQRRYFDGEVERETVATALGEAEALRLELLRQSLHRELPVPEREGDLPTDEAFYGREPPTASPDDGTADEAPDDPSRTSR